MTDRPAPSRRQFIEAAAVGASACLVTPAAKARAAASGEPNAFASVFDITPDRIWAGPEYWTNPLQDWRVAGGKLTCVNSRPGANVHLLTRQIGEQRGSITMSVAISRPNNQPLSKGKGSAGFRIGVHGEQYEYRNSLTYHIGIDAGFTADGRLFIDVMKSSQPGTIDTDRRAIVLHLNAKPADDDNYTIALAAEDPDGTQLGQIKRTIPGSRLPGNICLVNNLVRPGRRRKDNPNLAGLGLFAFADWRAAGDKLESHDDQVFGPIMFSQYTLTDRVMKMTAQMAPLGERNNRPVDLQIKRGGKWEKIAEAPIDADARVAAFRIEDWDDTTDTPYRLVYVLADTNGRTSIHEWTGVIRRDPVDQATITVGNVSCNIHAAFPNAEYVEHMASLKPDLLAFVGDQFYESTGGYGIIRKPVDAAMVDYLRKWYFHGWTWRQLMRDRPSISLPDDHDVYQGNIWGEGGHAAEGTNFATGGYVMDPRWVNVVHRCQTAHHPDAFDPTSIDQNISVYYGPLRWGRISFAVIADRMFKTGPRGTVPPRGPRADHVTDKKFDPKSADVPGAVLLGDRQHKFLEHWAADWRGADIKAVISQTAFTGMATTHGMDHKRLVSDFDSNGWPQTPRDHALRLIRKAHAMHICGDQHLGAVVHYGIDDHRDGPISFIGPAVNVGYTRWFEPLEPGANRAPGAPENTGDFNDSCGNRMTVMAVYNGRVEPRKDSTHQLMIDRGSGLGIVRFDKPSRKISIESWAFGVDPTRPNAQLPGWPVVVDVADNYARKIVGRLPEISIDGVTEPVLMVTDQATGELVYAIRLTESRVRPWVFESGTYTVKLGDPETDKWVTQADLKPDTTTGAT
ncbi:twin-arginine translocation pathway signal protein [Planctomycetales bacterium ZRK34]|nr:twin-arginine translocation pathway signal protein [Planctomycetales bacterium ZRK34]